MKKYRKAFEAAATKLSHAASQTADELRSGQIPDEPSFTVALVTRFKDALDGTPLAGLSWQAKVLSSHTEEPEFGADLLGVLRIALPEYQVVKGFLAQAKKQRPGSKLSAREWERLLRQCDAMLSFTPESYVFIYSSDGVHMVPAIAVVACSRPHDLHDLEPITTGKFYSEHFRCFIGDRRIDSAAPSALDALRVRAAIELVVEKGKGSLEER